MQTVKHGIVFVREANNILSPIMVLGSARLPVCSMQGYSRKLLTESMIMCHQLLVWDV